MSNGSDLTRQPSGLSADCVTNSRMTTSGSNRSRLVRIRRFIDGMAGQEDFVIRVIAEARRLIS